MLCAPYAIAALTARPWGEVMSACLGAQEGMRIVEIRDALERLGVTAAARLPAKASVSDWPQHGVVSVTDGTRFHAIAVSDGRVIDINSPQPQRIAAWLEANKAAYPMTHGWVEVR